MGLEPDEAPELQELSVHLTIARLERGLSQAQLAERCSLSQAQISYFEAGQRRPTIDQLLRIARALDVSIQKLISGLDRPGTELRDIAFELRHLGITDLWVKGALVPGAFRRAEEVIALAVAGNEPDPRVLEAIPAVLAWNEIDPFQLASYGLTVGPRMIGRLAWLADIVLSIDRKGGFPGGCRREQVARFIQIVSPSTPEGDAWDSLGRPMAATPTSPLWRRWKIKYDATLAEFEERAKHLDELRKQSGFLPEAKQACRILMMRQKSSKGGKRLSAFKSSPKIQRKPGKGRRHAK